MNIVIRTGTYHIRGVAGGYLKLWYEEIYSSFCYVDIYIGDIDIFSANNSNSGINNSKGTINSNASKLIANLFAWVVGVVQ